MQCGAKLAIVNASRNKNLINIKHRDWLSRTFGAESTEVKDFDYLCTLSQQNIVKYIQSKVKVENNRLMYQNTG